MELVLQEINKIYKGQDGILTQTYQKQLTEGEDFEKFEWLKRPLNNACYIYLDNKPFNNALHYISIKFRDEFQNRNTKQNEFGGVEERVFWAEGLNRTSIYASGNYDGWKAMVNSDNYNSTNYMGKNYRDFDGDLIGNKTDTAILTKWDNSIYEWKTLRTFNSNYSADNEYRNVFLFAGSNGTYYSARVSIAKFKIVSRTSNDVILSLTPCQLLRNCPPNLSSQGKLHLAGECGLYDSVSGLFHGNANSTGLFSVYND